jgi:prepilin-type N-terminal cleavage/methylation domain-containing protein
MLFTKNRKKESVSGFTLIELLVVISIIGLLSSVALTSVNAARQKAFNAKKMADFSNISSALQVFHATYNRMPNNYNPGSSACEGSTYYDQSMQELVNAGLLGAIPKSPDSRKYCYYNYGSNNTIGAIIVTTLAGNPASTVGVGASCRPFTNNWCSYTNANNYYCMCNPY